MNGTWSFGRRLGVGVIGVVALRAVVLEAVVALFESRVVPSRQALSRYLEELVAREEAVLLRARAAASDTATQAIRLTAGVVALMLVRGLIDDVRSAVNTTVMATETGSKAVDAGTRQFAEVAATLEQIGGQVATTTEAAREIELSTKQQTSAVEQVNVAVASVAQTTKEDEAGSLQTMQTARLLTTLSVDLHRLVVPDGEARA
jgi:hypothetical protein